MKTFLSCLLFLAAITVRAATTITVTNIAGLPPANASLTRDDLFMFYDVDNIGDKTRKLSVGQLWDSFGAMNVLEQFIAIAPGTNVTIQTNRQGWTTTWTINATGGTNSSGGGTNGVDGSTVTNIVTGISSNVFYWASNTISAVGIREGPVPFIIDKELDSDTDGPGMIGFAHSLMTDGRIRIIAAATPSGKTNLTYTASNPRTNSPYVMRAINHYYGRDYIPVGESSNQVIMGNYTGISDYIVTNYAAKMGVTNLAAPEMAVAVYRRALAAESNNSVVMVFGGQLNNLYDLFVSPPDVYSALGGRALITNKVKELVILGGNYGLGTTNIWIDYDYNWTSSGISAVSVLTNSAQVVNLLSNIPGVFTITFIDSGIEHGDVSGCVMPRTMQSYLSHDTNSPLASALLYGINTHQFFDWNREVWEGREAWSQMAVAWPVYGTNLGMTTVTGYQRVDFRGTNFWTNVVSGPFRYAHYQTDSTSLARLGGIITAVEAKAAPYNTSAKLLGGRIETDYPWIGRTESTHRSWLNSYFDFRPNYSNTPAGSAPIISTFGLNGLGVYNNSGVWSMTTNLAVDVPTNSVGIRGTDDVNGGFFYAGANGNSEFLVKGRRIQARNGSVYDVMGADGSLAASYGAGSNLLVGASETTGGIRPATSQDFWFSGSAGIQGWTLRSSGLLESHGKNLRLADTNSLYGAEIGTGPTLSTNAGSSEGVIRIVGTNSFHIAEQNGGTKILISSNGTAYFSNELNAASVKVQSGITIGTSVGAGQIVPSGTNIGITVLQGSGEFVGIDASGVLYRTNASAGTTFSTNQAGMIITNLTVPGNLDVGSITVNAFPQFLSNAGETNVTHFSLLGGVGSNTLRSVSITTNGSTFSITPEGATNLNFNVPSTGVASGTNEPSFVAWQTAVSNAYCEVLFARNIYAQFGEQKMTNSSVVLNTGGNWNTTTNVYTTAVAGVYHVIQNNNMGNSQTDFTYWMSPSTNAASLFSTAAGRYFNYVSGAGGGEVSTSFRLPAGATIQANMYLLTSGTRTNSLTTDSLKIMLVSP